MNRFEISTHVPEDCRADARGATEIVLKRRLTRAAQAAGVDLVGEPVCRWEADPDAFSHDGPTFSWIVIVTAPFEAAA